MIAPAAYALPFCIHRNATENKPADAALTGSAHRATPVELYFAITALFPLLPVFHHFPDRNRLL